MAAWVKIVLVLLTDSKLDQIELKYCYASASDNVIFPIPQLQKLLSQLLFNLFCFGKC
jgi:hypothetical protein